MAMIKRRTRGVLDGPRHSTTIEKNVTDSSALDGGHMDRMTEIGEADSKLGELEGQFREKRDEYFQIEASAIEPASQKAKILKQLRDELMRIKTEHEAVKEKAKDVLARDDEHLTELDKKCKQVENTVKGIRAILQFSDSSTVDEAERVLKEMQSAFEFQQKELDNAKNIIEGHKV